MLNYIVKKVGSVLPIRTVARYLIDRFVGKYIDDSNPIDLDTAQMDGSSLRLEDLNFNCRILNESLEKSTALRIIKLRVGSLVLSYDLNLRVTVSIDSVEIDMLPVDQPSDSSDKVIAKTQKTQQADSESQSMDRERATVDRSLAYILQQLEFSAQNICIRILSRKIPTTATISQTTEKIETILLRLKSINFTKPDPNQKILLSEPHASDVMSALAYKQLAVGEISVHLMRDYFLDTGEYSDDPQLDRLSFPMSYPLASHPSTLLLIKQAGHADNGALALSFDPDDKYSCINVAANIGSIEVICSHSQLRSLSAFSQIVVAQTPAMSQDPRLNIQTSAQATSLNSLKESNIKLQLSQDLLGDEAFMQTIMDVADTTSVQEETTRKEIDFRVTAKFELLQATYLSPQSLEEALEEDRIFAAFNRPDLNFTSAHVYYQVSLGGLELQIHKSQGKELKMHLERLAKPIKLCRYFRQEADVDDSALFKTCNEDLLYHSSVEEKVGSCSLISLRCAPKTEYTQSVLFQMDGVLFKFQPSYLRVKVKEQIYLSLATIDLVVLTTILRAIAPKNPQPQPERGSSTAADVKSSGMKIDFYVDKQICVEVKLTRDDSDYLSYGRRCLPICLQQSPYTIRLMVGKMAIEQRTELAQKPLLNISEASLSLCGQYKLCELVKVSALTVHQNLATAESGLDEQSLPSNMERPKFISYKSSNDHILPHQGDFLFKMDEPQRGLKVTVKAVKIGVDAPDLPFLVTMAQDQEFCVKHVSNLFDILSLSIEQPPAAVLKDQLPHRQKQPPTWLVLQIHDVKLIVRNSIELFQVRLLQTLVDVKMQGRDSTQNIEVSASMHQILVADMLSKQFDMYDDVTTKRINVAKQPLSEQMTGDDLIRSGRCILHPAISGVQPMLGINAKITFVESTKLHQRISIDQLQLESSTVEQIFQDLVEMKINPQQLQLVAKLHRINIAFNNTLKTLVDELQAIATQSTKFAAKRNSYKARYQNKIDLSLVKTSIKIDLRELTAIYQPALQLSKLYKALGESPHKLESSDVLRTNYLIALKLKNLDVDSNAVDSHKAGTNLLQVLFLKENNAYNLVNWVNYGGEGAQDQLSVLGFVEVLSLTELRFKLKPGQIKVRALTVHAGVCRDTVSKLLEFQRLAQVGLAQNVEALDSMMEQTVQKSTSGTSNLASEFQNDNSAESELNFEFDANGEHAYSESQEENDLVIIDARQKDQSAVQKKKLMRKLIDWEYFKPLKFENNFGQLAQRDHCSQKEIVHLIPENLKGQETTIQVFLKLTSLQVILFAGEDLNFKQQTLPKSQDTEAKQPAKSQPSIVNFDKKFNVDNDYLRNPNASDPCVSLFERAKTNKRDLKQHLDLLVNEVVITRRQFPIVAEHKFKTFAFSIGSVALVARNRIDQCDVIGTPYSSRHKNFYEMSIVSEKDYDKNCEYQSVTLGLRPLVVTITPLPVEFVKQFLHGIQRSADETQEHSMPQQPIATPSAAAADENKEATQVLIRSLKVRETVVILSVNYIAGLLQFDKFTMKIRPYTQISGVPLSIPEALDQFTTFQTKETLHNLYRVFYVFGSFKIVQEFTRCFGNVLSPIYRPLQGIKSGPRGVIVGFGLGLQDASRYLTEEGWRWSNALFGLIM